MAILKWTSARPPGEDNCRYDHCIANTPFGRFLITWKGWKEYDYPTVDETPWGDWYETFHSVEQAQRACEDEYCRRLQAALAEPEPELPTMFKPDGVHPFVVRHYTDDERPSIKGNGFDGLEVGEDRQEAEEFIAWINARLCPSRSNLDG